MRLTKKLYIVTIERGEVIDYTPLGQPIYADSKTIYTPFKCKTEPYSNHKAEYQYGVFVDCSHRVFCRPNKNIKILSKLKFNQNEESEEYEVTQVLEYDRHMEVLMKRTGGA
ncbi:hypothetical protein [Halalkalibacter sp. APA_J-10(15)]|uniref:hypothetical protein n=1 Tax=Halalkalibacter sp. APA_J-10(15) TaxID=2933805 RepID=UPI001FF3F1D7|nr:hypothetical protein [Halalkalibacter sp. APA_J-10(15)]MCK0470889.1 hypothetical protein [Halalkalibacter sp. APA_J-10(15)]